MARELSIAYPAGYTLYALIRRPSDAKVWNGSAFVAWVNGNITAYAIAMTNEGGDLYQADWPTMAAGTYRVDYFEQIGGSPAIIDLLIPEPISREVMWTGGSLTAPSTGTALTTKELVKQYLNLSGTTYDASIDALIVWISSALPKWCDRDSFITAVYTSVINGTGRNYLVTRNVPITALTSIVLDYDRDSPLTITGSNFQYEPDTGWIAFDPDSTATRRRFSAGFQNVQVNYTAGYSSVPADLQYIATLAVATAFSISRIDPTLESERIGNYSYKTNTAFMIAQLKIGTDPAFEQVRDLLMSGGYRQIHAGVF